MYSYTIMNYSKHHKYYVNSIPRLSDKDYIFLKKIFISQSKRY